MVNTKKGMNVNQLAKFFNLLMEEGYGELEVEIPALPRSKIEGVSYCKLDNVIYIKTVDEKSKK